jgi:hypothetical protein
MAKVRLSVSVSDTHLKHLGKVAKAAEKAGMKIDQRLESLGVFTGSIDASKRQRLHEIEGVSGVEEERTVGVPPPDSSIQ